MTGAETITEWRRVVEEIVPSGATEGPYSLASTTTGSLDPGMVALRINYPHQSAGMVAYIQVSGGNVLTIPEVLASDDNDFINIPVQAEDNSAFDARTLPAGYSLTAVGVNTDHDATAHRGTDGMGELQAFATIDNPDSKVRPYRKVLTAQGIYRREVFAPPPTLIPPPDPVPGP
ncbi:MAG: hypothetical protein ACK5Q5_23810, partial [Planctomycetaceae bacterium]